MHIFINQHMHISIMSNIFCSSPIRKCKNYDPITRKCKNQNSKCIDHAKTPRCHKCYYVSYQGYISYAMKRMYKRDSSNNKTELIVIGFYCEYCGDRFILEEFKDGIKQPLYTKEINFSQ